MANVGYIGLGVMGGHMVARLISKGHKVSGYNRTRSKAEWLIQQGMKWGDPAKVAESADFIFTMVTNASAMEAVAEGPDGFLAGIAPGKILIDMTTGSPAKSKQMAAEVREKGADMVDAPVSGSPVTLQQGKLSIMVGGRAGNFRSREAAARRHRPQGYPRG